MVGAVVVANIGGATIGGRAVEVGENYVLVEQPWTGARLWVARRHQELNSATGVCRQVEAVHWCTVWEPPAKSAGVEYVDSAGFLLRLHRNPEVVVWSGGPRSGTAFERVRSDHAYAAAMASADWVPEDTKKKIREVLR